MDPLADVSQLMTPDLPLQSIYPHTEVPDTEDGVWPSLGPQLQAFACSQL